MEEQYSPARAEEETRLAALARYAILDTPAELGYDDIALIASQVCRTPVALVSFVDRDRQWFKARVGFEACETPLDQSVCAHALGRTEVLVIPDLTLDARTSENTLVTAEPRIRFYAGAPMVAPGGQVLGTLCVIDRVPRPEGLTPEQAATLEALARQVVAQLELRRALAERDAARDQGAAEQARAHADAARLEALIETQRIVAGAGADLDTVFQAISDGALSVVDAATGAVVELRENDQLRYRTASGSSASHLGAVVPIGNTLSGRSLLGGSALVCRDTHIDPAGEFAIARAFGVRSMVTVPIARDGMAIGVLKLQSGEPDAFAARDVLMARMLGGLVASGLGEAAEAQTRHALAEAENRYRQVFDSAVEFAIVVTDTDGIVTEWNTGAERIFGWSSGEMRGGTAERFFTPEDRAADRIGVEMRRALLDGKATDERWHLRKDGSRFWASGELMPLRGRAAEPLGFVKILRDRTLEHRAGERLREAELRLRQAQAAGGVGIFSIDVGSGIVECTPEFCRLFGFPERERMPAAAFEGLVVPEDRALASSDATRMAGRSTVDVQYRIRRADTGEERWIARKGELERDAQGVPLRFIGAAQDITDKVSARRELEDEREQLAQMFAQAPTFMALLRGPDHRVERVNPGYVRLIGGREIVGRTIAEALEDAAAQGFVEVLDRVYRTGEPFVASGARYAMQAETGGPVDERFVDFVFQPIRSATGDVVGIFIEGADVTDRARAAAALRETENRYGKLFNAIDEGFCLIEMIFDAGGRPVDYRFLETNASFDRQTGLVGARGRTARDLVPTLEAHWFETYGRVAATGESIRFRNLATPMESRWFEVFAFRLDDQRPNEVGILFSDISAQVTGEERRKMLNAELAHRLKNTLAIVSSIATQTLRTATDVPSARKVLTNRIQALSSAHDILLTGQRDAASIAAVVRSAVSLHDEGGRVETTGPDVILGPKAALTLSLIVHELATNAGKYGALSVPGGRVLVEWSAKPGTPSEHPRLVFEWREVGGPPVTAPTRKSFGTRLIGMGLSGSSEGSVDMQFAPDGLRCLIEASLTELQSEDEDNAGR